MKEQEMQSNLLCNALEGGSNYWYMIQNHNRKEVGAEFVHETPFKENGFIELDDSYTGEGTLDAPVKITLEAAQKGWEIFKEKYPKHYANVLSENDDAETGDVYLQCIVFGEAIYG